MSKIREGSDWQKMFFCRKVQASSSVFRTRGIFELSLLGNLVEGRLWVHTGLFVRVLGGRAITRNRLE